VKIAGTFWDQPAGDFKWRGIATGRTPAAAAAAVPSSDAGFEPDASGRR
jgi:hypothetical protein